MSSKTNSLLLPYSTITLFLGLALAPAWTPSDLTVYGSARKIEFPSGFQIVDDTSPSAKVVKTVSGPADATISAYMDASGTRYYMSDWSYERFQSKGIKPNWIRGEVAGGDRGVARASDTRSSVQKSSDFKQAFVAGVSNYEAARKLRNATNDAVLMAKTLAGMGFQVHDGGALIDPDADQLSGKFLEFVSGLSEKSEVVVYFAGHGLQAGGKNLLLPRDFELPEGMSDAKALRFAKAQSLNLSRMLSSLDRTGATVSVVFLDCCRDTGFLDVGAGLVADGALADPAVTTGDILVGFAAKHGQRALDGRGENSPFAASLARRIGVPGSALRKVLSDVTAEVVASTGRRQQPFFYGSLTREVYLAGEPAGIGGAGGGAIVGKPETLEKLISQIKIGKSRDDIRALMGEPKRSREITRRESELDQDLVFESYRAEGYAIQCFYGRLEEGGASALLAFTLHLYRGAVPIYRGHPNNLLFVLGKSSSRDVWKMNEGKPHTAYKIGIGSRWRGAVVSEYYWGRKGHYAHWLTSARVTDFTDKVKIDPDQALRALGVVWTEAYCPFIAEYVGTPLSESEDGL